jgi:hypothetical protein
MHRNFGLYNFKGRYHLGDLGVDGRIPITWTLNKQIVRMWDGFMWLKIESGGGLLRKRQ